MTTILAPRGQVLLEGIGAVVVIPVRRGNILKQPEITLAQPIAHIVKTGEFRRMLACSPGSGPAYRPRSCWRCAQSYPVVAALLLGLAVFLLLPVKGLPWLSGVLPYSADSLTRTSLGREIVEQQFVVRPAVVFLALATGTQPRVLCTFICASIAVRFPRAGAGHAAPASQFSWRQYKELNWYFQMRLRSAS